MVQKNAITIAAMVAPLDDSRLLAISSCLRVSRATWRAERGSTTGSMHFDGHRISLCFRIWITLNTMSGMTRMNSSDGECGRVSVALESLLLIDHLEREHGRVRAATGHDGHDVVDLQRADRDRRHARRRWRVGCPAA